LATEAPVNRGRIMSIYWSVWHDDNYAFEFHGAFDSLEEAKRCADTVIEIVDGKPTRRWKRWLSQGSGVFEWRDVGPIERGVAL
jgi:hypothetical protein